MNSCLSGWLRSPCPVAPYAWATSWTERAAWTPLAPPGGGLLHDLNPETAPLQQREQTVEVLEIEQVAGPEDVHQSSPSRLGVFIHALSPTRVAQLEAKLVECWAAAQSGKVGVDP